MKWLVAWIDRLFDRRTTEPPRSVRPFALKPESIRSGIARVAVDIGEGPYLEIDNREIDDLVRQAHRAGWHLEYIDHKCIVAFYRYATEAEMLADQERKREAAKSGKAFTRHVVHFWMQSGLSQ